MANAARIGDTIDGMTTGEHAGHYDEYGNPIHGISTITGSIITGSSNVFINGLGAARTGDITEEFDVCDTGSGTIGQGSLSVFINGKSASRLGDPINPHNGTASITSGSANVYIGG